MSNKKAAIKIIRHLRGSGFEALLAGGCVRDMLLSRTANDYDVATSASPDEVVRLFRRTLKIGAKFGVVMVLADSQQVEVATFRTESGYVDGRHPGEVVFSDAKEDASRRDFTINGMFYDPIEDKVIDYVGGRADLKKRIIRTIGDPQQRFAEDYLRILRAIRFSTQLGFKIEAGTWEAVRENAGNITKISLERIAMELEAILTHPNRGEGSVKLAESGLMGAIFPKFSDEEAAKGIAVLKSLGKNINFPIALAALFVDCETGFVLEKCSTLRLSRGQNKHIRFLLDNRGRLLDGEMSLAELRQILAEPYFEDLYKFQKAIQDVGGGSLSAMVKLRKRAKKLAGVVLKPKPLINGHELIRLGAAPGPEVGRLVQELYIQQLEEKLRTARQCREWALKWLEKRRREIDL